MSETDDQDKAAPSATERVVARILEETLKRGPIGVDDDFFEAGGNSMTASLVSYRMGDEFGYEFPLVLVFENPTVAEMARAIDAIIAAAD
jgi:hypothetical protein